MSNRYGYLFASFHFVPASKQTSVSVWHIPIAICTVLNSWWWTERPPKHVESYAKINNLRNWCIWLVLLQEYITTVQVSALIGQILYGKSEGLHRKLRDGNKKSKICPTATFTAKQLLLRHCLRFQIKNLLNSSNRSSSVLWSPLLDFQPGAAVWRHMSPLSHVIVTCVFQLRDEIRVFRSTSAER
jgi:hypothetical protein